MKIFKKMKDGGPESTVVGYWLIEAKKLFSICLLNFQGQSREAFHTHAFSAISWVIKGELRETMFDGTVKLHKPSLKPIITPRDDFHKVDSIGSSTWVFSLRGPWARYWQEYLPETDEFVVLTNGRTEISRRPAYEPTL